MASDLEGKGALRRIPAYRAGDIQDPNLQVLLRQAGVSGRARY